MFKAGETVNYPGYGICKIKTIQDRKSQNPKYILEPISDKQRSSYMISEEKANELGVHPPIKVREVNRVYQALQSEPENIVEDRNKEYEGSRKKIYSGDLIKVAETLRDLEALKDLIFAGKKMQLIKTARQILVAELSFSEKKSPRHIQERIDEHLWVLKEVISDAG